LRDGRYSNAVKPGIAIKISQAHIDEYGPKYSWNPLIKHNLTSRMRNITKTLRKIKKIKN
jgi:hypothetical protein